MKHRKRLPIDYVAVPGTEMPSSEHINDLLQRLRALAQQAQPEYEWEVFENTNAHQVGLGYKWSIRRKDTPHINVGIFRFKEEAEEILAARQQAQPEMPTREMILEALADLNYDDLARVGDVVPRSCFDAVTDAVLALFAKETP